MSSNEQLGLILAAIVLSTVFYFSVMGISVYATYALIGYSIFHIFLIVLISAFRIGQEEKSQMSIPMKLLLASFLCLIAYHLYLMGYVFLAGTMTGTISILILQNAFIKDT